jgi:hypothetical protein
MPQPQFLPPPVRLGSGSPPSVYSLSVGRVRFEFPALRIVLQLSMQQNKISIVVVHTPGLPEQVTVGMDRALLVSGGIRDLFQRCDLLQRVPQQHPRTAANMRQDASAFPLVSVPIFAECDKAFHLDDDMGCNYGGSSEISVLALACFYTAASNC